MAISAAQSLCTACGACCSYDAGWPRFTLEDEADIARIPPELVSLSGMRCEGDRCCALVGKVGVATSCSIYALRPDVCRACQLGDEACTMARLRYGFAPISAELATD